MSLKTYNFSIHDLVKIRSNWDLFRGSYRVKRASSPDIILNIGDFHFDKNRCPKLGLKFWGGDRQLYLEYPFYGLKIMKILIKNLEGEPSEIYANEFHKGIWGMGSLINFVMGMKLLRKGCAAVHSACVQRGDDGEGALISAWSEMGKSSTVLALLKKGYYFLADDYTIIDEGGTGYSFGKHIGVFPHTANRALLKMNLRQKVGARFRVLLSKIPPLYLYVDTCELIDVGDIGKIKSRTRIRKLFLLDWGNNGLYGIDTERATRRLVASTRAAFFNHFGTRELLLAYSYLNPSFSLEEVIADFKRILGNCLQKVDCFVVESKKKDDYAKMIYQFLEK